MEAKVNPRFSGAGHSGRSPPLQSTAELTPPPIPPVIPPDPINLSHFPPLIPITSSAPASSSSPNLNSIQKLSHTSVSNPPSFSSTTTDSISAQNPQISPISTIHPNPRSEMNTIHTSVNPQKFFPTFSTQPSSSSLPSSSKGLLPPPTSPFNPRLSTHDTAPPLKTKPSWSDKVKLNADMSLKRVAPVSISPAGIPSVEIPDDVFEEGEALHREFIVGHFLGKAPAFSQIQSVLNYLWGKGRKLEIHVNHSTRKMLIRLPNEFIRTKVLEKRLWYIGSSMFHVTQWSPENNLEETPAMDTIPLWAHLKGVPIELRHNRGLSYVAGLVGEPKETDEFTINLVSLTVAHVKVEVDLSKPLPTTVEVKRKNGKSVQVGVQYPWIPPSCSNCKAIGHILRNCHLPLAPQTTSGSSQSPPNTSLSPSNSHVSTPPVSSHPSQVTSQPPMTSSFTPPPTTPYKKNPSPDPQPEKSITPLHLDSPPIILTSTKNPNNPTSVSPVNLETFPISSPICSSPPVIESTILALPATPSRLPFFGAHLANPSAPINLDHPFNPFTTTPQIPSLSSLPSSLKKSPSSPSILSSITSDPLPSGEDHLPSL